MNMCIVKTIKIGKGKTTIMFYGGNIWECQMNSQTFSFQGVNKCGNCQSDDLYMRARETTEKYHYLEIVCKNCKSVLTFGNRKDNPDTYYPRRYKEGNKEGQYIWKGYPKNDKRDNKSNNDPTPF